MSQKAYECMVGLLRLLSLSVCLLCIAPAGASESCKNVQSISHRHSFRGDAITHRTPVIRLDLPSAGFLTLEIIESDSLSAPRWIDLLDGGCGGLERRAWIVDRSATHLTLAVPQAGPHDVRIASQDPRQSVGRYRLVPRFVPAVVWQDTIALDLGAGQPSKQRWLMGNSFSFYVDTGEVRNLKTELEEVDPDPSGHPFYGDLWDQELVAQLVVLGHGTFTDSKTELEEVDPDPSGAHAPDITRLDILMTPRRAASRRTPQSVSSRRDSVLARVSLTGMGQWKREFEKAHGLRWRDAARAVLELDGRLPFASDGPDALPWQQLVAGVYGPARSPEGAGERFVLTEGCRLDIVDDHEDTFACATPLGVGDAVEGAIGGRRVEDWHGDVDTFSFSLDRLTTLEVSATGSAVADALIYDRHGQLLGHRASDGHLPVRRVKTLSAGRYFVRLVGDGISEGAYALGLRQLD